MEGGDKETEEVSADEEEEDNGADSGVEEQEEEEGGEPRTMPMVIDISTSPVAIGTRHGNRHRTIESSDEEIEDTMHRYECAYLYIRF